MINYNCWQHLYESGVIYTSLKWTIVHSFILKFIQTFFVVTYSIFAIPLWRMIWQYKVENYIHNSFWFSFNITSEFNAIWWSPIVISSYFYCDVLFSMTMIYFSVIFIHDNILWINLVSNSSSVISGCDFCDDSMYFPYV